MLVYAKDKYNNFLKNKVFLPLLDLDDFTIIRIRDLDDYVSN